MSIGCLCFHVFCCGFPCFLQKFLLVRPISSRGPCGGVWGRLRSLCLDMSQGGLAASISYGHPLVLTPVSFLFVDLAASLLVKGAFLGWGRHDGWFGSWLLVRLVLMVSAQWIPGLRSIGSLVCERLVSAGFGWFGSFWWLPKYSRKILAVTSCFDGLSKDRNLLSTGCTARSNSQIWTPQTAREEEYDS